MQKIVVHPRETLERRLEVPARTQPSDSSIADNVDPPVMFSSNGFMGFSSNGFMGF
jgi:hypothetical protein